MGLGDKAEKGLSKLMGLFIAAGVIIIAVVVLTPQEKEKK